MISYGDIDKKGADDPDPHGDMMVPTGEEFELRNDSTASDGLNGSMRFGERPFVALGLEQGDRIKIYAEANGRWIQYERDSYSDRYGVGMPRSHRDKLNLDEENRTVKVWLDEPDEPEPEEDSVESLPDSGTQVSLTGEEADEREFVFFLDDDAPSYHFVNSPTDDATECGIGFEDRKFQTSPSPFEAFEECSECASQSPEDMSNRELVAWLGERAGFEPSDSAPSYLSKEKLVNLHHYVDELEKQVLDETGEEGESNGAGLAGRTALGQS